MLETELRYAANCSPKVLCVAVVSMLQSLKNSRQGSLARPIDYYTDKNETEKKRKKIQVRKIIIRGGHHSDSVKMKAKMI